MMSSLAASLPVLLAAVVALVCGEEVTVQPLASNCSVPNVCAMKGNETLDQALQFAADTASHVTLRLLPGCHCVQDYIPVWNTADITLAGVGPGDEVVVTCVDGLGLSFFNATRLTIRNITMDGCGLTGKPLTDFHTELNKTVDFFFTVLEQYRIALLCGLCSNFTLTDSTIMNTAGLGLLGVNVVGNSLLSNVNFTLNFPPNICFFTSLFNISDTRYVGGGALFSYHDYHNRAIPRSSSSLVIEKSTFLKDSYCGFEPLYEIYYNTSKTAREIGFQLGAGGGLSIVMAQVEFPVSTSVSSTVFQNNTARYGGAVYIGMFSGISGCHVSFHNCTFEKNGLSDHTDVSNSSLIIISSAGMTLFKDITRPDQSVGPMAVPLNRFNNSLIIKGTSFTRNRAGGSSSILIVSQFVSEQSRGRDYVEIDACTFTENVGSTGAVIYAVENKRSGQQAGLRLFLKDTVMVDNEIHTLVNQDLRSPDSSASIINLVSMEVSISGNSTFSHNYGTAINIVDSLVRFYDDVTFFNNSGIYGGALRLLDSSTVVVQNHSHITFERNSAAVSGGAIYADYTGSISSYIHYDCVLFFERVDILCFIEDVYSCVDVRTVEAKIDFLNNTANTGGLMFGSTLDTCPWGFRLKAVLNTSDELLFDILYYNLSSIFNFGGVPPTNIDIVSTQAKSIAVGNSLDKPVKPGQIFYLNVTGKDYFNRDVPVILTTNGLGTSTYSAEIGESGYWYTGQGKFTPVSIEGYSNETLTVDLYGAVSLAQTEFTVNLSMCSPGFRYSSSEQICECDPAVLKKTSVLCSVETQTLNVSNGHWIGLMDGNELSNSDSELVFGDCLFDYCDIGVRNITPPFFEVQCHRGYNRMGLLCGQCQENHSIGFGSNRCLKCETNYGVWWFLFFAIAGVLLILAISFLGFTISDGYLNGILLYCNIVALYQTAFLSDSPLFQYLIGISFLNLNLGIESCFFHGMDQLARVGLQFIFPAYLYFLMLVVILLSKRSVRLLRLFTDSGFSASKLFATLLVMTYTSLFDTCAEVLAAIKVTTLSGQSSIRWRLDPHHKYFSGAHGFLGVFSIVILLVYIIPFPLLLFFHKFAFKIELIRRLEPVRDALVAPFKPTFFFWIGLRLILRVIPLTFVAALSSPLNVFLMGLAMLLLFFFQVLVWPFKGAAQNTFDIFLISNIVFLALETLYFTIHTTESGTDDIAYYRRLQYAIVCLVVTTAYITFILIFLWHLALRFPALKKIPKWCSKRCRNKMKLFSSKEASMSTQVSSSYGANDPTSNSIEYEDITDGPIATTEDMTYRERSPVHFSELREPLLEEGTVDLVSIQ